jgi:ADP-ribosylglycohydrolase
MNDDGPDPVLGRAQGCLLGQLAGDSLGSLVEFKTPGEILAVYPGGVRDLADGGTWGTLAGQPTDDSEMALALARMLVEKDGYDPGEARKAYLAWLDSRPFDCGVTIGSGLHGILMPGSQANGALMRISPLGIFGSRFDLHRVAEWAAQDAMLTHPNPFCIQANALFAMAIAHAIRSGLHSRELYWQIDAWARERNVDRPLLDVIAAAQGSPPADYLTNRGWVLVAFGNAIWQLLHARSLEEGVIDTVLRGGDTDTNAAICGALLGAVYGREAVPERWSRAILDCRPEEGRPGVNRPRPNQFWPVDALELAEQLLTAPAPGDPPA